MPVSSLSVSNYTASVDARTGMHIDVTQASKEDLGNGYTKYSFTYTETNNTDLRITQESFALYLSDGTAERQYGFFNYIYPGDASTRTFQTTILSSATPTVLEYDADNFFSSTPILESTKWAVTDTSVNSIPLSEVVDATLIPSSPVVAEAIIDASSREGSAYIYDASPSFSDIDGDALSYTATLSNGNTLPSWLTMSSTGTLSGTPVSSDVGVIEVTVIAADPYGAFVTDTFSLTIKDTTAPTIVVSETFVSASGTVIVQSSELGTAYVVSTQHSLPQLGWSSFTGVPEQLWTSGSIDKIDTYSSVPVAGLSEGDYRIYVADAAGNLSSASTSVITIDNSAPTLLSLAISDDDRIDRSDDVTQVVFSGTTVNVENGDVVSITFGGVISSAVVSDNAFTGEINISSLELDSTTVATGGVVTLGSTILQTSISVDTPFMSNVLPIGTLKILSQVSSTLSGQAYEFQANTYTTSIQRDPSVTGLIDGGWIITWSSLGQDGSDLGIFGQRYSSSGLALGDEFQINNNTSFQQHPVNVSALYDGGWIVTWGSENYDGSGFGIFGQRYNRLGDSVNGEFQINTYSLGHQSFGSVSSLLNGGWVVTWQSESSQDGDSSGIYGQRYNTAGEPAGSEFLVNTYTTGDQKAPSVSSLADGGWIVTWQSTGQDGNSYGIYGQRYSSLGEAVDDEFQINTFNYYRQFGSSSTGLVDGGWVVTWSSQVQVGGGFIMNILGQRYTSSGDPVGDEFQVNTNYGYQQHWSSVTALLDGGWVVTWRSSDGYEIYGQRYSSSGETVNDTFLINSYTEGHQDNPSVSSLLDGGWIVTWHSNDQDGDGYGIYGQRFGVDGTTSITYTSNIEATTNDFLENNTLYAQANQITDANGIGVISLQWQRSVDDGRDWDDIAGANSDNYTLADDDVGYLVRLKGTYTDGFGYTENVYSDFSSAINNINDAPVVASAITDASTNQGMHYIYDASPSFSDIDGDALSYTATLSNGNTLPSWLTMSSTGTLSGTPANSEVGALEVTVTATDSSSETANDKFYLTVVNTNDAAIITAENTSISEDVAMVTGTATHTDVDANNDANVFTVAGSTSSTYGIYSVATNGDWTYTLDNTSSTIQALGLGESTTDSITVTAEDGTAEAITITINGTNDAAIITAADSSITKGVATTLTSTATHTDIDANNDANVFTPVSTTSSAYGSYSVTTGGVWTYTLDNSNTTIQALVLGESTTDSITVTAEDGTTETITITINGANDAAKLLSSYSTSPANVIDNLTIELWKENTQVGGDIAITKGEVLVDSTTDFDQVRISQSDAFDTNSAINVFDVLLTVESIVGISTLTGSAKQAADVNNDSNVNVFDVLAMVEHIVGVSSIDHFDMVDSSGDRITQLTSITSGDVPEYYLVMNGDVNMDGAFNEGYITTVDIV
jgi:VCBS repeat-containing protein